MASELGVGFSNRIDRYREELTRDDTSVEIMEGLAFVYTKVSLFSAALLLYDDWY